jgi:ParB/RepB/Spo0J family partition protein
MNAPEFAKAPPDAVAVASLRVSEILPSRSNPRKRFDDTYIAELADSIKSHGLIQPITVRPLPLEGLLEFNRTTPNRADAADVPTYEIVVGECRWRAAKLAGLTDIPAFWRELDDKQVLEIQVIENLQRRDVHPIEEAEGYQALIARHGYTADDIAAKIGKSRAYVYARIKLTALCREAREAFFDGKLEASVALLVARIPGEALQKRATKEVTNGYDNQPLAYRAAQMHLRNRYTLSLKQATFRPDDAKLLPAAGACSTCPKLSGNFQDLFNDIDDPDVCTDPDCFEAKRLARREHLIASAEKRKIPVFIGDKGREALDGDIEYVSLDADVDDDAEGRTYRQILGDKVPAAALIEFPYGKRDLTECATLPTLEAALRKAGWKPAEDPPPDTAGMSDEEKAKAAAARAEREEHNRRWTLLEDQAGIESERRAGLLDTIWPRLHDTEIDTDHLTEQLLYLMAEAWLRQSACYFYDFPEHAFRTHIDAGYALPEEYDDEVEIDRACSLLHRAPLGRVLALMFDENMGDERRVTAGELDAGPARSPIIDGLSKLFAPPTTTKPSKTKPAKTVSTPSNAAQAPEAKAAAAPADTAKPVLKPTAKKAKAKADPAPTTSANEPAAPAKPPKLDTWPFPTGARP